MKIVNRSSWRNHLGNQVIQPLRLYVPETVSDLVTVVREAERLRCTVRAVGSGHSFSDVGLTPGFLVDTSALNRILPIEAGLVRAGVAASNLVATEAGIPLSKLNAALDAQGQALLNMGGYDAQTVAGVVSTSTHGSGLAFGPLSDEIRSIDLVAGRGTIYRIERTAGPTDPAAFASRYPDRQLLQNNDSFNAVVVGLGCMGIIYSVILEVEPKFWLKEVRVPQTWSQVKSDLQAGLVLKQNEHYEFLFNPYVVNGNHQCLVTTRNRAPQPVNLPQDKLERHPLSEVLSSLPIVHRLINLVSRQLPKLTPTLINGAIESLKDDNYTNLSYKVFNIGAANKLPAYSMEIGVPIDDNMSHIKAIERIMAIAAEHRRVGDVFETGPVAVRFVKASEAYLSMMQGRNTAMIELIMLTDTDGGYELLGAYEEALYELSGRPHWGQVNYLNEDLVRELYPRFDDWLRVRRTLDPQGTFDSPFTKRVGISQRGFGTA